MRGPLVTAKARSPSVPKKRKLISYLSPIPRKIWPKDRKYYWIIGAFERR